MEEIWKDIDLRDIYQVSSIGRVKNITTNRCFSIRTDTSGYSYVGLMLNKIQTNVGVHRLVAKAFIPNPENKPQVNHINGDKFDNRVENLEWATPSNNTNHAFSSELRKHIKPYDTCWVNIDLNLTFTGNTANLVRSYPEQKLLAMGLSRLRCGSLKSYKGWTIFK